MGDAPARRCFIGDLSKASRRLERKDTFAKRKQRLRDEGCISLKCLTLEVKSFAESRLFSVSSAPLFRAFAHENRRVHSVAAAWPVADAKAHTPPSLTSNGLCSA